MPDIPYITEIAHFISVLSIMYSIILFTLTVKIRIHPSFPYFCLATLLLALLPNQWFVIHDRGTDFTLILMNIKYIFFNTAMIALGRAFVLIGLHRKLIHACMLPFIAFLAISLLSIFFGIDILILRTDSGLAISPFYRNVFFPVLATVFIIVLADMIYHMNNESVLNRKLIRLLVIGISVLIFFGIADMLYYIMYNAELDISSIFFNISAFGILVFNIYTLLFITEIIYNNLQKKKLFNAHNSSFVEPKTEHDREIYDSITNTIIEEKLFNDPDLDLVSLADFVGIHRNEVSRVINTYSGDNFKGFINRFRVNELKELLNEPGNRTDSILKLGLEVGFNSKATLNRVFKQYEEISPQKFRKKE